MSNESVMIILLIVGLTKSIFKMSYFPEPLTCSKNKIKFAIKKLQKKRNRHRLIKFC